MKALLPALLAAALLATAASAQPAPITLVENGPRAERINVAVVAEGYREADLDAFQAAAGRLIDALFATAPYDRYAAFFNAYAVPTVSAEAGADRPARSEARDTYLSATFGCGGVHRSLCLGGDGERRLNALLRDALPEYDVALVLVNDAEYGGSGGRVAVVSAHAAAAEIAVHEMGHTLAGLADEYGGGAAAGFASRNTATDAHPAHVPWSAWLDDATPLPTPDDAAHGHVVGAFEGAAYADHGAYRPERHCRMRALGHGFCAVCNEHHIGAIYDRVSPIAAAWPAESDVTAGAGRLAFRVDALVPAGQARYEWTVDGVTVGTSAALALDAGDLPPGASHVEVRVTDATDEVRDSTLVPLLSDVRAWTVTRPAATAAESGAGGADTATRLGLAAPNPVRHAARLPFRLAEGGAVRLSVYDALGREVAVLVDGERPAGLHEATWSAGALAAGVYVVRLEAPGATATQVVTVAR
ncbi:M64 family metallopeptidase [Rubrivirga sp. S365]|uniref:M64 family metallopeptidase n=1 Tax=Rubrivirga litoralis TaxID=3075598 RepID=A0ABU3BSM6_9BACT|nr:MULTISPECIES: M64 family metallopeptidase [unclassified Rubrivirga]MDT0632283.1 M64 family metallopeptidase [Rubrivirga sp. F394]MDT7856332.1 M64 family metallopeptidase [Rubrivirga sp. S365]